MIETHPAYNGYKENIQKNGKLLKGGFLLPDSNKIIIGTFPPYNEYNNKSDFFFYPSPKNHFWNRIDNIFKNDDKYVPLKKTKKRNFNESIHSNNERKKSFCVRNKLSFIDCFSKIERKLINSTSDADIIPKEDIIGNNFIIDYILHVSSKNIYLLFTYKTAFEYFKNRIEEKDYQITESDEPLSANKKRYSFKIENKTINLILMFPATRSRDKGCIKDNQYEYFLFKK